MLWPWSSCLENRAGDVGDEDDFGRRQQVRIGLTCYSLLSIWSFGHASASLITAVSVASSVVSSVAAKRLTRLSRNAWCALLMVFRCAL